MGDTLFSNRLPFIDVDGGGSIQGVIAAVEKALSLGDGETLYIAGHGPVINKDGLKEYRDMLISARDEILALKVAGKSLDEIVKSRPLDDLDAKWLTGADWTDNFIGFVFNSPA
jgi:glyoxylase-like metal-dependent hydrolase (beta-lactamase superfamily II)